MVIPCSAQENHEEAAIACQRAMGFLELGMPEDALAELEELPEGAAGLSPALHLKVDALFRLQQWARAAEILSLIHI